MKRLLPFFIFTALLTAMVGCGQKGSTTNANVTIVAGGFTGAIPGQTGGTMLMGYNPRTGRSFSKPFDGAPIELRNDFWDFAAISWDGEGTGSIMQGVTTCAVLRNVALTGGKKAVRLNLSSANCLDSFFGANNTKEANGEPKPLQPADCADPKEVRDSFGGNPCKNSIAQSYQVIFPGKRLDGSPALGLVSACVQDSDTTTSEMTNTTEKIELPLIFPGLWNLPIVVDLFDGANCTGQRDRVVIRNYFSGDTNRGTAQLNQQPGLAYNEIRISKNPCSSPEGQASPPFQTAPGLYALCNPDQFEGIDTNAITRGYNYELYANLDFSGKGDYGAPIIANGAFTGTLDGRGFAIRNVSFNQVSAGPTGIFDIIDGDGTLTGDQANVKNLTLENISIESDGAQNGALASQVYIGSTINRVKLNNISITVNAAAINGHGALAGSLTNIAGNGGANTRVSGILAKNIRITTTAAAAQIGGLVGSMNASNALVDSVIDGFIFNPKTSASDEIGGVVGVQVNSEIIGVTARNISLGTIEALTGDVRNLSTGSNTIGGFVGRSQGATIRDSKAVSSIRGGGVEVGGFAGAAVGVEFDNNVSVISMPIGARDNTGGHIGNLNVLNGTPSVVSLSRSFGSVNCATNNCGGFVGNITRGFADTIDVVNCYSKADVTSVGSTAGGFFGYITSTPLDQNITLNQVAAFGDITGANNTGGLGGYAQWAIIQDSYSRNIDVTGGGTRAGGLYAMVDQVTITRNYTDSPVNGGASIEAPCVGGNTNHTFTDVYHISDGAADSRCDGAIATGNIDNLGSYTNFTSPPWLVVPGNGIELEYIHILSQIGEQYTGSSTDPFILSTPQQWNAIGDTPPLMDKTFRLGASLNFQGITFNPIGSSTSAFKGSFQGNNYTIENINFVDTIATEPVGIFRKLEVAPDNPTTTIGQQSIFNREEEKRLILRNVNISKDNGISGPAGLLAGQVVDDGADTASNLHFHDTNKAIKISGIEIYGSTLNGGKAALSPVGGLIGIFTHTNGNSEIRDIRIFDSTITSGVQNQGTGGVIGRTTGTLNATDTPAIKDFGDFILDNVNVLAPISVGTTYVGGGVGYLGVASKTANWGKFVISNTNVQGHARVGGVVGDTGFGNVLKQGSFINGSVNGETLVGGIAGNLSQGTVRGYLSKTTVSASGNVAGCLAGQGSGGGFLLIFQTPWRCAPKLPQAPMPAILSPSVFMHFLHKKVFI